MCGIVGLFLKDTSLHFKLGALLEHMLVTMTDRGPDSAGIALYQDGNAQRYKITVQSDQADEKFPALADQIRQKISGGVEVTRKDSHAVIDVAAAQSEKARAMLATMDGIRIMSSGDRIEIYKEVGLPKDVVQRFGIAHRGGTHAIGHTRMATESTVTTLGAHPFSTGADQCLVHNGSLSNHNNVRRVLKKQGINCVTENDSEVAAAYLSAKMAQGHNLKGALEQSLIDLDGFFTFVVGTASGFGVLRDGIACKPAVLAETSQYVAMGSEYRALVGLPDIKNAKIWEPEPATVYFWEH